MLHSVLMLIFAGENFCMAMRGRRRSDGCDGRVR
jgi:hypothetical protein